MAMRITRLAEAEPFDPPGHAKVGPVRLLDAGAAGGKITVALSHYLPGGLYAVSPTARTFRRACS
jgi:hypothetical protein